MREEYDNPMRRQLYSVEPLIAELYPEAEKRTRKIITTPEIYSLKEVILTGCGDSYCVALSVAAAFEQFAGLKARAMPAMELARYYPAEKMGTMPFNPLVIGISNSGRVTRVTEAVMRARSHGALTLAITANEDSPLAQAAERSVALSIPPFEKSPGIRNYVVNMMELFLLAVRFGEVLGRYTMDEAGVYRRAIRDSVSGMVEMLAAQDEKVFALAKKYAHTTSAEMLAQGTDASSGLFFQQKLYEAVGIHSVYGDSESWFHNNKFLRDFGNTVTFVLLSEKDRGRERMLEAMQRMDYMKREYIVITDDDGAEGEQTLHTKAAGYELFAPMTRYAIPTLFISYLTALKGEKYSRGFEYPFCDAPGIPGTVASELKLVD